MMVRDHTRPGWPFHGFWFEEPLVKYENDNKTDFYLIYISAEIMSAILMIQFIWLAVVVSGIHIAIVILFAFLFFVICCIIPINAYFSYRKYVVLRNKLDDKTAPKSEENLVQKDAAKPEEDSNLVNEEFIK